MLQSFQSTLARRRLLLGSTISGLGALIGGASSMAAQQPPGAPGIQILQYDPPRRYAAGARVGNVSYLAGEEGMVRSSPTEWYIVRAGSDRRPRKSSRTFAPACALSAAT